MDTRSRREGLERSCCTVLLFPQSAPFPSDRLTCSSLVTLDTTQLEPAMTVSLSQPPSQDHQLFTSRDLRPPNFAAYKPPREIKGGHRASVRCLGWNTDGRRLASAGVDKVVRVWTPERSLELRSSIELKGHTETVDALAWDPTHPERLATAGQDSTVRLWDIRSGTATFTTQTPGTNINLTFHPKGHLIAVGNRDDDISLIDVRAGGKLLGTIKPSPPDSKEEINEITWSNSGSIFIATTGTGCVRVMDSRSSNDVSPPKVASESASALAQEVAAKTSAEATAVGKNEEASAMEVDEEKKADVAAAAAAAPVTMTPAMVARQSLSQTVPWESVYTLLAHTATIFCAQFDPLGR